MDSLLKMPELSAKVQDLDDFDTEFMTDAHKEALENLISYKPQKKEETMEEQKEGQAAETWPSCCDAKGQCSRTTTADESDGTQGKREEVEQEEEPPEESGGNAWFYATVGVAAVAAIGIACYKVF